MTRKSRASYYVGTTIIGMVVPHLGLSDLIKCFQQHAKHHTFQNLLNSYREEIYRRKASPLYYVLSGFMEFSVLIPARLKFSNVKIYICLTVKQEHNVSQ